MKKIYFLLCVFLMSSILLVNTVFAQPLSQTFNTSGTYTVPAGYGAIVTIQAWGGGGSGGGGNNTNGDRGGGGGGAYASLSTTLTAGSYTVTVGAGGVAPAASGAGQNGGASSFTALVVAAGGTAGSNAANPGGGGAGGTIAASTGSTKFAGGAGGARATALGNGGGGGGGSATTTANGGNGGTSNNNAGGTPGTGTGAGGTGGANNGTSTNGTAPGGGGGGKGQNGNTSGNGAAGRVIVTVTTVLPVRISSIRAYEKQNGVQIDWTVYSEENLSKYQVERSVNGNTFIPIGDVTARNSSAASNYGYFDVNPLPGVSFYRLRSVDLDGKYGLSSIVRINLDKNAKGIKVYPNPVAGSFVSVQSAGLAKGNYSIKIFTATGQLVKSQKFIHTGGSVNQTIQLPAGVKSGMYTMQLNNDGVKVMSRSFMVLQ